MTVNSTSTKALNIGDLIRIAYQQAGILNVAESLSNDRLVFGQDKLDIIVESLVTYGAFVRQIELYDLTVEAGVSEYTLPSSILNLIDTATFLPSGSTSGDTHLTKMSRDDWLGITNKTAQGRPSLYYAHRYAEPLQVKLWLVPSEAGTITFQAQKLFADTNNSSNTLEAGRHWNDYFVWRMAHDIALAAGQPIQRVGYIRGLADKALEKAANYSNEGVADRFMHEHNSGYTG